MTATQSRADHKAPRPLCPSEIKRLARAALRRQQTAEKRTHRRNQSYLRITDVVERVAIVRKVDWKDILCPDRGCPAIASARVLAMGICTALEVPQFHVAKAFSRTWATIYSAEVRCSELYRESPAFRKEWDDLMKATGIPTNQ